MLVRIADLYFLNLAGSKLAIYLQNLASARNNPLPTRYLSLVVAMAVYSSYLIFLQAARGNTNVLIEQIKTILPEFNATGASLPVLKVVFYLLEKYCPNHDLDCLVNLALRRSPPTVDALDTSDNNLFLTAIERIKEALRVQLVKAIQVNTPSFSGNDAGGQPLPLNVLWDGAPFTYNRQQAAQYAVDLSRNNFQNYFPYGDGNKIYDPNDISKPDFRGTVGGKFLYPKDVLRHEQGFTGSAIFISEVIHEGSIPMTYSLATTGGADINGCSQETGSQTSGWRVCTVQPGATQSWKFHFDLLKKPFEKTGCCLKPS